MLKAKVDAPDDLNPQETSEWVEALDEMIDEAGPDRASYLLEHLMERAANLGVQVPLRWNTPYINTIPPEEEVAYPGDRAIERRIKSLVRWNATAMVVRANKYDANIGGHLATPDPGKVAAALEKAELSEERVTQFEQVMDAAGLITPAVEKTLTALLVARLRHIRQSE